MSFGICLGRESLAGPQSLVADDWRQPWKLVDARAAPEENPSQRPSAALIRFVVKPICAWVGHPCSQPAYAPRLARRRLQQRHHRPALLDRTSLDGTCANRCADRRAHSRSIASQSLNPAFKGSISYCHPTFSFSSLPQLATRATSLCCRRQVM